MTRGTLAYYGILAVWLLFQVLVWALLPRGGVQGLPAMGLNILIFLLFVVALIRLVKMPEQWKNPPMRWKK